MSSSETFMVQELDKRVARNGDPFLIGSVCNSKQTYEVCIWHVALLRDGVVLHPGDLIEAVWEHKTYKGKPQLDVTSLLNVIPLKDVTDFAPYVRASYVTKDYWIHHYYSHVEGLIEDEAIKKLVEALVINGKLFWVAPAAKGHHHHFVGGLAEHTLHILKLFLGLLTANHPQVSKVRKSLVIAGIIFHDWAKCKDYEQVAPGVFAMTRFGSLVSHLPGGPLLIERYIQKLGIQISEELWLNLMHVLLSHHGSLAFGSPIVPSTLEALVVHYLDVLDGKLWMLDNAEEGRFVRGLDGWAQKVHPEAL